MADDVDSLPLFPEPEPTGRPPAGLGSDARATWLRKQRMTSGLHAVARLPLHIEAADPDDRRSAGRRCGSCAYLWTRYTESGSEFRKCPVAAGQPIPTGPRTRWQNGADIAGPDMRQWWPACQLHTFNRKANP